MKFITFIHKGKEQIGVLSLDESKVLKISKILGHERYEDIEPVHRGSHRTGPGHHRPGENQ